VIRATIFTGRESHKNIIIGKGGAAIKKTGTEARQSIEAFTGKKVFLELFVKVEANWKDDEKMLRYFGYHR
jgi:GTP-binding protein Era